MERQDLFNEVKSWLEAGEFEFNADSENATFEVGVSTTNGMVRVSLYCEDSPSILQVVCPLPLRVPKEKVSQTALFLHNLNAHLRFGAFFFNTEHRVIVFRVAMPVRPETELASQFSEGVSTAVGTWDDHLPTLSLLLSSTESAQKAVAKFAPESDEDAASSGLSTTRRLEMN